MSEIKEYKNKTGKTAKAIGDNLSWYLKTSEKMDTQVIVSNDGSTIVQGKTSKADFKKWFGMNEAVQVNIVASNETVRVEIGKGKWIDKGLIPAFVYGPTRFFVLKGFIKHMALSNKIFDYISICLDE